MITITLNPALDISGTVDNLIPDEKSYVYGEIHTPGGNGINAAIVAHRIGVDVVTSGFLGGTNGEEIRSLLDAQNVNHSFISISNNTRMNLTISNSKNHKQTRLSFPGPKILPEELRKIENFLLKIRSQDIVVLGGSLPPGVKTSYVAKIVKSLKDRGIICIVDMPGLHLSKVIFSKPFLIKPNLIEFQALVKKNVFEIKTILPLVRKLNKKVPLICVSSVEGGAILVTKDEAWYGKIPKVKIRSSVGAGDSMVGAISAALIKNPQTPLNDLLREGLAAACATLAEPGMALASRKNFYKYLSKISLKQID